MGGTVSRRESVLFSYLAVAPDLLALHRLKPERYPCLLESTGTGQARERHDLLLVSTGEHLTLRQPGLLTANGAPIGSGFLDSLDRWWRSLPHPAHEQTLPFQGGWFLFLSYELAAEIEPRLRSRIACADDGALPLASALRCPAALIHDQATGRTALVAEAGHKALCDEIRADIAALPQQEGGDTPLAFDTLDEEAPQRFLDGVERIQAYIARGDVFQVNLSRAWSARLTHAVDDAAIYRRLRRVNPAPFSALARIGDATVISSSPERLVSVRSGTIETRPIAGTHPRGADPDSDQALVAALLAHPKERAEHIMLIDLERNDLGRVCLPGTVRVDELMTVETYAHVHHIVSNVCGQLRPGTTPGDVIRAVFPGGTITGCPKIRCMEIIAELEHTARGAYTGAVGYLGRNGDMDLNILIRTLVRYGDRVSLRAGAGIVADSVGERELDETRAKARGLLRVFDER